VQDELRRSTQRDAIVCGWRQLPLLAAKATAKEVSVFMTMSLR
jgi:hypothetical protein